MTSCIKLGLGSGSCALGLMITCGNLKPNTCIANVCCDNPYLYSGRLDSVSWLFPSEVVVPAIFLESNFSLGKTDPSQPHRLKAKTSLPRLDRKRMFSVFTSKIGLSLLDSPWLCDCLSNPRYTCFHVKTFQMHSYGKYTFYKMGSRCTEAEVTVHTNHSSGCLYDPLKEYLYQRHEQSSLCSFKTADCKSI